MAVTAPPASGEPKKPKDSRDLEDLLDFIEGNPSLKCKDEKKAAKKARQKQKKVTFIYLNNLCVNIKMGRPTQYRHSYKCATERIKLKGNIKNILY